MILLTDEAIRDLRPRLSECGVCNASTEECRLTELGKTHCWTRRVAKEQIKKTLISVGKESKRMDGTIYLVPDYVEYRKALKGVGLE